MRGRGIRPDSDSARTRLRARLREMHVNGLPAAGLLYHHHGGSGDEGRSIGVIAEALRLGSLPPARRSPVTRDQRHVAPDEHLDVVRFPPPGVDAIAVVLPQPGPVLQSDIRVA